TAEDLTNLLNDSRPAVKKRAIQTLADHGDGILPAVEKALHSSTSPELRRNAIWAATRIDSPKARETVRIALKDRDESVRHAAIHSISVRMDKEATPMLLEALHDNSAQIQRVAAEALGRFGDSQAVPKLLDAIAN